MKLSYGRQEEREKKVSFIKAPSIVHSIFFSFNCSLLKVELQNGVSARDFDRSLMLLPENRCSWRDHPLTAWGIENGSVWLQCLTSKRLVYSLFYQRALKFIKSVDFSFEASLFLALQMRRVPC